MAMLGPPFVRGLLVGSDPKNAAGLHRELGNDRCFEVYGWIHQSPEHVSGSPNDRIEQLAANRLTIPQDAIASLLQRLVRSALALIPSATV